MALASTVVLGVIGIRASKIFAKTHETTGPIKVADIEEIPVNGYKLFHFPTRHDPCILIHRSDGEYLAFSQSCTHLLCPVHYLPNKDQFRCPCHEGYFSAQDGQPLAGPPKRALPSYPVEVRDGQIWVNAPDEPA